MAEDGNWERLRGFWNRLRPSIWNFVRTIGWLAIAAFVLHYAFRFCPGSCGDPALAQCCDSLGLSLWAIGGGILGALLNVGRLRMSKRLAQDNRIQRGLDAEPAVGAGVALIAYLVFLTRQISIFPVVETEGVPTVPRVLLLGLLAGLLWEPFLRRIDQVAKEDKSQTS